MTVEHRPEAFDVPDVRDIRAMRTELGLSQREVAEFVGVHPHTVCSWEKRRTEPELSQIEQMLDLFSEGEASVSAD